jgi:hypothetical protein
VSGHETLGSTFCASTTTWQYDARRGWLAAKQYADGKGPEYEYLPSGKIKSRKWARGINTAYRYTPSGQLAGQDYGDNTTPNVSYTYDRLGRRIRDEQSLSEIPNVRSEIKRSEASLEYSAAGLLASETQTEGPLAGLKLSHSYDSLNRRIALEASHDSRITLQSFTYDAASRLQTVSEGDDTHQLQLACQFAVGGPY